MDKPLHDTQALKLRIAHLRVLHVHRIAQFPLCFVTAVMSYHDDQDGNEYPVSITFPELRVGELRLEPGDVGEMIFKKVESAYHERKRRERTNK
jgi:hypothetical protein